MIKNNLYILLGMIIILIFWTIGSTMIDNSLVLPGFDEVLLSLGDILSNLSTFILILNTILKLVLIIFVSLIIAMALAILSYISSKFENFIKPIFVIIKTIPVIAIIILLLIVLGNDKSPYIMTILVVLPIIYEGLLGSLKNIDKEIIDDVKTVSKINFKVIIYIYFPLIFNFFFTTIIQTFGIGLKVMVMGEFVAQPNNSIGYILQLERSNLNTSALLAWSIILIIIVFVFEMIVVKLSKYVVKTY
jgi:NitT/TauT family transport system permease protein